MKLTAYPVSGKQKSYQICEAFVAAVGGSIATKADRLLPGASFFYGVDHSNQHLYVQARSESIEDWYYCDNSYFDSARQEYFRITKNRLQHSGLGVSTGERFRLLGVTIRPWQPEGKHIVVCPQSDHFMHNVVGYKGSWEKSILASLQKVTERPIRVREWNRDKGKLSASLGEDLIDAYCLVTWSSAAAITAILAGIPALVESPDCAALPQAVSRISRINSLRGEGRENWAGVLADNQWTIDEMRRGVAWKMLQ